MKVLSYYNILINHNPDKYRYYTFYGGRGASKSWGVAMALLIIASKERKVILCAREIQASIKESVHRLLSNIINQDKVLSNFFKITDKNITGRNGSEFIFNGLRFNSDEVKGLESADICWIEEAKNLSKESFTYLDPTIRKSGSFIVITFNPELEDDFVYERFVLNPPKKSYLLKLNYNQNPYFNEILTNQMEEMKETDYERYLWVWEGCTVEISEAQVFKGKYVVKDFEIDNTFSDPYFGLDFGFSIDPLASSESYIKDNVLYVYKELWKKKLDLNDTKEALLSVMPEIQNNRCYADSARPESISHLINDGLTLMEKCKKWTGCVKDGISYLKSFDKIIIHETNCPYTAIEFKKYSYAINKNGDVIPNKIISNYDHVIDSLRYAHQDNMGSTFPIFKAPLNYLCSKDEIKDIKNPKILGGFHFGDKVSAIKLVYNEQNDTIYINNSVVESNLTPIHFSHLLKSWGKMSFAWDSGKANENLAIIQQYKIAGIDFLYNRAEDDNRVYSVEQGNNEILNRIFTGRFKINENLNNVILEFNNYNKTNGKRIEVNTGLISAVRNAVIMLKFSRHQKVSFFKQRPTNNW